jgi:hypothetical protein
LGLQKKERWPQIGKGKTSLEKRQMIQAEAMRLKTGIGIIVLAGMAGAERGGDETQQESAEVLLADAGGAGSDSRVLPGTA